MLKIHPLEEFFQQVRRKSPLVFCEKSKLKNFAKFAHAMATFGFSRKFVNFHVEDLPKVVSEFRFWSEFIKKSKTEVK